MWGHDDTSTVVIAGHSRPKDGVASLAYDPAIHLSSKKAGSPGHGASRRPGDDSGE